MTPTASAFSDQPTTEQNLSTLLSRAAREPEPFVMKSGRTPEYIANIARAKQDGTFDKTRDDFNYTYANAKHRKWMNSDGSIMEFTKPDDWAAFARNLSKQYGDVFDPVLGFQLADRQRDPNAPQSGYMRSAIGSIKSNAGTMGPRSDAELASPVRRAAPRPQAGQGSIQGAANSAAAAFGTMASDQPKTMADALAKARSSQAVARTLGRGPAPINPIFEENAAREDAIRMLTRGGKTRPSPVRRAPSMPTAAAFGRSY